MTNSPLELLSFFSSMNAPVEYYMTFMFPKNSKDLFVLDNPSMVEIINKYLQKLTKSKTIKRFAGKNDNDDFFKAMRESYNSEANQYDSAVKDNHVKTYSWKFVDKKLIHIDELKDGAWSLVSFFINPKYTYEKTDALLKELAVELASKFKVSIKLDTRIIGEDYAVFSKYRTLACMNNHYKTNYKNLTDFSEKNFVDFYFHYDCKDLEMRHKMLDDPLTKENVKTKLDTEYMNNIGIQRKQMIMSQHLPPITFLHSYTINELGWVEKTHSYIRPTPMIDFGLDWISYTPVDGVNPSGIYKMFQESFYEITRRDIYNDDERQLNELRELLATQYANIITVEDQQGKDDVERDIMIYIERCNSNLELINSKPLSFRRYFCRAE